MTTFLVITSAILAVLYTGIAVWRKHELPDSISAMVYDLPRKWQWIWSAWLVAVTSCLAPSLFEKVEYGGWILVVLLTGTALTPLIDKKKRRWHYPLAISAGLISQAIVAALSPWWLLMWILMVVFVLSAIAGFNDKSEGATFLDGKGVFVAEVICAVTLIGSLI